MKKYSSGNCSLQKARTRSVSVGVLTLEHALFELFEEVGLMGIQCCDNESRVVHDHIIFIYVDDHYCPVEVVACARDELVGSVTNNVEVF